MYFSFLKSKRFYINRKDRLSFSYALLKAVVANSTPRYDSHLVIESSDHLYPPVCETDGHRGYSTIRCWYPRLRLRLGFLHLQDNLQLQHARLPHHQHRVVLVNHATLIQTILNILHGVCSIDT